MDDIDTDEDDLRAQKYASYTDEKRKAFLGAMLSGLIESLQNATLVENPTPHQIVNQAISLLRSVIVANFSWIETLEETDGLGGLQLGGASGSSAGGVGGAVEDINQVERELPGRSRSTNFEKLGAFVHNELILHMPVTLFSALADLVADVENYKRVHGEREKQERIAMNKKDGEDIATMKARAIREASIAKSTATRVAAAELLLLSLRSLFHCNCVALRRNKAARKAGAPNEFEYLDSML